MTSNSFYSDWVSIDNNRILLVSRDGFPSDEEKFIARVSSEFLKHNSSGKARITQIFYDDKACVHSVHIASTDKEDSKLDEALTSILHGIFNCGNYLVHVEIFPRGNESSDHYNHMEYLAMNSGMIKK